MNGSKTIENRRDIGGDYFRVQYLRKSNMYLKDILDKFNFDDYWCFKATGHQRLVSYSEFLDFRYATYIFFKKYFYDNNKILEWVNWFKELGGIQYLIKPTPPFPPQKVIIRK